MHIYIYIYIYIIIITITCNIHWMCYGVTVPGTWWLGWYIWASRTLAFNSQYISNTTEPNGDSHDASSRHLLFTDNFTKPYSHDIFYFTSYPLHSNIHYAFLN